jgi:hypothetical protein
VERYVLHWSGTVNDNHYEDGHPSEPFKGWFTDTRQCHWTITSRIARTVSLVNHNGEPFQRTELAVPLSLSFANKGSDFVLLDLAPENCGKAQARYESDLANSRQHIRDSFGPGVAEDFASVLVTMRSWPQVNRVQPSN